jgi:AcrR family transcriptional regulator
MKTVPRILGSTLAEHRATTRDLLFQSLAALMEERGLDAITMADIAARAGLGRTAVYNHFADKESLLLAYISDQVHGYVDRLDAALQLETGGPVAQLRAYVRAQVQLKHIYHLPGADVRRMVSPATAARMREHSGILSSLLTRVVEDGIAEGVFPPQDVETTVSLVNACLTGRHLPADEPDRSTAIVATQDFVLRAVGVDPS